MGIVLRKEQEINPERDSKKDPLPREVHFIYALRRAPWLLRDD
jgi:hypothetical protein